MSLHPSLLPAGRSMLSRPVLQAWPEPDSVSTNHLARQDAQLYRSMMWSEFRLIIERVLGENREYLDLGDEEAFALIMDVVWNGLTHAEAAQDKCRAEDLVQRHREYAESGALPTFLVIYSSLHYRVAALIQECSLNAERVRARRNAGGPQRGA